MAIRLKSKWFREDKPRTTEELAGAVAYIQWQIAIDRIKHLEGQGYYIDLPMRTISTIGEFLAFLSHLSDRAAFNVYDQEGRDKFVSAMVKRLTEMLEDNLSDARDTSQGKADFVNMFNQRFSEYAEFAFDGFEPSYGAYRCFGHNVANVLGEQHNRWVVEQVIEIEAPEAFSTLKRALGNLGLTDADAK